MVSTLNLPEKYQGNDLDASMYFPTAVENNVLQEKEMTIFVFSQFIQ